MFSLIAIGSGSNICKSQSSSLASFIHNILKTSLIKIYKKGLYCWYSSIKLLIMLQILLVVFKFLCSAKCKRKHAHIHLWSTAITSQSDTSILRCVTQSFVARNCINFTNSKPLKVCWVSIWCTLRSKYHAYVSSSIVLQGSIHTFFLYTVQ